MGRAAAAGTGLLANVVAGVGSAMGASRAPLDETFGSGGGGLDRRGKAEGTCDDVGSLPLRLYRRNNEEHPVIGGPLQAGTSLPGAEAVLRPADGGNAPEIAERTRISGRGFDSTAQARDALPLPTGGGRGVAAAGSGIKGTSRASTKVERREGGALERQFGGVRSSATYSATGYAEIGTPTAASGDRDHDSNENVGSSGEETRVSAGFSALGMASATSGAVLRGLWGGLQGVQSVALAHQHGGEGGGVRDPPAIRLYRREGDDADGR